MYQEKQEGWIEMRFLVQRVQEAAVKVEDEVIGEIGRGFLVFVGVSQTDDRQIADKLMDKLAKLRIFEDEDGKTNRSIADVGGEFLVVSQFTLYADCRRGNRPSFIGAGNPELACKLYEYVMEGLRAKGFRVQHGSFGADMRVSLVNDGPFTVLLDSDEIVKK